MVASGCAAGLAHATTACVTGGNPDLHVRVPDLTGFAKDKVVIPKHSRNQYDQAVVRSAFASSKPPTRRNTKPRSDLRLPWCTYSPVPGGNRTAALRSHLRNRQETKYSRPGGRRHRNVDHSERPSATRRDPGRLRRRKASADLNPPDFFSAAKIWCKRRGWPARRITATGAR